MPMATGRRTQPSKVCKVEAVINTEAFAYVEAIYNFTPNTVFWNQLRFDFTAQGRYALFLKVR